MRRGPGFCPGCGERVSPFAAGCALCGADLDPRRHQRRGPALPALPALGGVGEAVAQRIAWRDVALLAILVLLALMAPLIGLVLALVSAYDRHRNGALTVRNLALAAAALAFVAVLDPAFRVRLLFDLGIL